MSGSLFTQIQIPRIPIILRRPYQGAEIIGRKEWIRYSGENPRIPGTEASLDTCHQRKFDFQRPGIGYPGNAGKAAIQPDFHACGDMKSECKTATDGQRHVDTMIGIVNKGTRSNRSATHALEITALIYIDPQIPRGKGKAADKKTTGQECSSPAHQTISLQTDRWLL